MKQCSTQSKVKAQYIFPGQCQVHQQHRRSQEHASKLQTKQSSAFLILNKENKIVKQATVIAWEGLIYF